MVEYLRDEEDGRSGRAAGQATLATVRARRPAGTCRAGPRRARRAPHGRHHLLDDAARAPQARAAESHPQAADRERRGRAGAGRQPSAQSVRADARRDEEDEGRRNDEDDEADGWIERDGRSALTRRIDVASEEQLVPEINLIHMSILALVCAV